MGSGQQSRVRVTGASLACLSPVAVIVQERVVVRMSLVGALLLLFIVQEWGEGTGSYLAG